MKELTIKDKQQTKDMPFETLLCDVDLVEIDIWEIFRMGIDYGQLIMEQERQGE